MLGKEEGSGATSEGVRVNDSDSTRETGGNSGGEEV